MIYHHERRDFLSFMTKENKIRLISGALVVTMAASMAFVNPQKAYAATNYVLLLNRMDSYTR